MPSTTFFNLSAEKREKLLRAARAEFSRAPYDQASVNQIIRAAGIPRGSFYMYFTDKEELFHYLLGEYGRGMETLVREHLEKCGGNLFDGLISAYDRVTAGEDPTCASLMDIMRHNGQMRSELLFVHAGCEVTLEWMEHCVDLTALNLQQEGDFAAMLGVLLGITGGAAIAVARGEAPEQVRTRLHHVFEILKRGMVRECPQSQK